MDRKPIDSTIDDDRNHHHNDDNTNDSTNSSTDDKTYHFRKGSDLDGFESFGALFADGLFTDLAICCSGRVFRCHRVVMAASSQYIKNALSAFQTSDHQNNCNTIMILPQDVKVQDMEAILHFIYNGQVEVTRDAIESFLSSAKILHIKGLANIKLVYNNSSNNHNNGKQSANNTNHTINSTNNSNSNLNNSTNNTNNVKNNNNSVKNSMNNNSANKSINNENQNSQNFNNFNNNCVNNENNNIISSNNNMNNNNINNISPTAATTAATKRRNGFIGGQSANRSPKLKTDLNFNHNFVDNIPQNQSFHSSPQRSPPQELDSKSNHVSARRKQKVPTKTSPHTPATNGLVVNHKEAANGETNNWITVDDEEELTQESPAIEERSSETSLKAALKKLVDSKDMIEKSVSDASVDVPNGGAASADDSSPAMPCLIQIDADPTTFPSFISENLDLKGAKRRRSSSLRLEGKHHKSGGHSLVKAHRNGDQSVKQTMVRSSNRKLGYIAFHKKTPTTLWNSSNKWKCEICNKLYGNKQTLKEHMDYFHSNRAEQIYTCSVCAKEYTWKKSLMKHYRDIHQMTNTSLSQMVATSTPTSGGRGVKNEDMSGDSNTPAALEWVTTQSQDNSSQSK